MLPGGDGKPLQLFDGILLYHLIHHHRPTFVISLAKPYVLPLSQPRRSDKHLLQILIDSG